MKRHQQHARCDADPIGAGSDRRGCRQDRRQVPVFDEVVLRQPDVIKPVVLAPCDLIEDFAVETVGGLAMASPYLGLTGMCMTAMLPS